MKKLEFKEMCKLHFDVFLLVLALVFLTGCKTAAWQEASDFYRSCILM